jgi:hypothetical protein
MRNKFFFSWGFVMQEKVKQATRLFRMLTLPLLLPVGEIFTARRMLKGIKRRVEHAKDRSLQVYTVTAL